MSCGSKPFRKAGSPHPTEATSLARGEERRGSKVSVLEPASLPVLLTWQRRAGMAAAGSNLVPITRSFLAKFYDKHPLEPFGPELVQLQEPAHRSHGRRRCRTQEA